MFKKIIQGYKSLFLFAAKITALLLVCLGLGVAVVWPLWKFAVSAPNMYTICILTIIASAFLFFLIGKFREMTVKNAVRLILQAVIIAGTAALCIFFILSGRRILTLPVLVAAFFLFGICRFQ